MLMPSINYDEVSDTLYIAFSPGEKGTGIELNEHVLLRLNKTERRAVGLTILEYSVVAQQTELGPRSFPLSGLAELSEELRGLVIDILLQPPVSDFLAVLAYTPNVGETIPITTLKNPPLLAA